MNNQQQQLARNLHQGFHYLLEDGQEVIYQGFKPKYGHIIKFFPDSNNEFTVPHDSKFFVKEQ